MDASSFGFFPLFTSTLTGIQELWTAIVPPPRCAFIVNRTFTFLYDVNFGLTDTAFNFSGPVEFVGLHVSVPPTSAQAQLELIKHNPFLLHGDTYWLSVDLRVFVVRSGEAKFGVPGVKDPTDAPRFIQQLMANITPTQFDSLSGDEGESKLFVQPRDENQVPVFNFALAKGTTSA